MGEEQDAFIVFRVERADDVFGFQSGIVVGGKHGFLFVYFGPETFQFGGKIVAACFMGIGVRYAWAEFYLVFNKNIGAVGIERRRCCHWRLADCRYFLLLVLCLATGEQ